jgi:single-strand DNA-binding protein
MYDTAVLTIAGNVVADPKVSGSAASPDRVTFRVVSNRRRRDPETGEWKQVGEFGINVVCWRRLARGVAQALRRGDPVVVQGRVTERKYTDENQQMRWLTELTADFVGHDLSQGYADRFSRFTQIDAGADRPGTAADATAGEGAGASGDSDAGDDAISDGFDDVVAGAFESAEPAAVF